MRALNALMRLGGCTGYYVPLVANVSYVRAYMTSSKTLNSAYEYIKTCVKRPLSKRPNIGFQDQLVLNEGHKYCRMLHSAIISTFNKLPLRSLFCLFRRGRFTKYLLRYHVLFLDF